MYILYLFTGISYWLKIIKLSSKNDNLVCKIYSELLHLNVEKAQMKTWCTQIKDLLNKSGFGYVWLEQYVENDKEFLKIFGQRVTDMYQQEWKTDV